MKTNNYLITLWRALLNWLEHGDLVPWMVIVSAVHYSVILQQHDGWVTATAIGLMVDLGHFRTVRAAVRYNPGKQKSKRARENGKREAVTRWAMAAFMTVVSVAYQQRFYQDWWLSLPLPFLIASLAWLQQKDQRAGTKPKTETLALETDKPAKSESKTNERPLTPVLYVAPNGKTNGNGHALHTCPFCERTFTSKNALNPHVAKCKARQAVEV